ncbi:putative phage tail assembly chaperone [Pasteurella multocida]|uniref:Uncharacterized protein n=1 Tax=Pasteurella multocida TaxID=747 RepID=A0AAW8VAD0_PASMD|nr:putative phage tail assembly chaperone [Pasteurella multocida]MDH7436197.1 putative phage tail assembly chaperone [Pasteurella multocida]MDH7440003.1 putative phage tail assembly chaperone [Pasteurella multocida]MDT3453431.1 hypothetical protein [Pasteurella multocida]MDY0427570.1 hypothetical protein [Pasteurella multocida]MDY0434051.1 hypothetical protein [Pasteurella multocida]
MELQHEFELNGVRYVMTPANAMGAWSAIKNALKLVQGVDLSSVKAGEKEQVGYAILTHLLSCLGDPSVKALEDIVLKHTTCCVDGSRYRLSDNPDKHFNQYRSHLIQVLVEGVKYQFADFFSGGGGLLPSILPANLNK